MTDYFDTLTKHRRELHRIPETAFCEKKTGAYIRNVLNGLGVFTLEDVARTGIAAVYSRGGDGGYIAFRSDMDALKIREETGLEFSSEHDGFMHACGHDLHMAILLCLARYIKDTLPEKNIILIFQPAEEGFGGGELMVKEGLFDRYEVKQIYALHNTVEYPVGTIALNGGRMFAGTIEFEFDMTGKGGHAAVPHENNDLVTASAFLVGMLNNIVPRNLDPVKENLITVGMIRAGEAANIMPSEAVVKGTARSYHKDDLVRIKDKLKDSANAVSVAFGIRTKLVIHSEYVPAVNDPGIVSAVKNTDFGKGITVSECEKKMTGEDFGFMLEKAPGAIAWLGAGNDTNKAYGLHHQSYSPDEKSMMAGFIYYTKLLTNF